MYTIGLDFGTLSGRAVLVDTATGYEIATAVYNYPHGVIDQHLPQNTIPLPPDWALQEPADYLEVLEHTIPTILQEHQISAEQVVGLGIDFTACTMLPTRADGTPLCWIDTWRDNPHAWTKLWKHHAAQTQAEQITHMAAQMGETWIKRYGGVIFSEWFLSKALETLQKAPAVYQAAARFIEAGDWLVWQLTGQESRSIALAGFKASYQDGAYPSDAYLAALHPELPHLTTSKMGHHITALSLRAGGLSEAFASKLGLQPGIAVAVANIDAHAAVPAVQATQAGQMVLILGTSTCHIISDEKLRELDGVAGVVDGGVVSGLYGYEAGQASVGDTFSWFVEHMVPPVCHTAAQAEGISVYHSILKFF